MKFDFTGKTVVVTGAGHGLCKTIAEEFAKVGANVVVNDINDTCKAVADSINANGGKAIAVQCDVSNSDAVIKMFDEVKDTFGGTDILVAGAVYLPEKEKQVYLHETENSEWVRGINVNINGTFYCDQCAARQMKEKGCGRIINITSDMAFAPSPKMGVLAAGKAGIIQLTRVAAEELGDFGITVNAVSVGAILTEDTKEALDSEAGKEYLSYVPGHKFGKAEDVTNSVMFLASDEAGYVSGNQLMVDGGWSTGFSRDF